LEASRRTVRVVFAGLAVAVSKRAWRVLETSHPPVYYIPPDDTRVELLRPTRRASFCEFKGSATYYDLVAGERSSRDAAWAYPAPSRAFASIAGYFAFYASRVDACYVDDELVAAQPGDFYGGWITRDIVGPFKGGPQTAGW
jgi:uncharacterized protein (DUF427 family)